MFAKDKIIKEKLLELYPDGVVVGLSSQHSSLYRKIYPHAKNNYNMKIKIYLEDILGLKVQRKYNTLIDTKTLEYISDNFSNFHHSEIYAHLDYSRQNYHEKLDNKINYSGKWQNNKLSLKVFKQVEKLVKENKSKVITSDYLLKILNNDTGFFVLYIKFDNLGVFQQIKEPQLLSQLKEKQYDRLLRDEYLFFLKLKDAYEEEVKSQEYYDLVTKVDNRKKIQVFAKDKGLSGKQYLNDYLKLEFIHSNEKSPKEMKNLLSQYKVKEPNYIHINTTNKTIYHNLLRKVRRQYNGISSTEGFKKLAKKYGFIHVCTEDNIYIYKNDLKKYEVADNILYLPSTVDVYNNFYNYCRRRNISIDEGLNELGLERLDFSELSDKQLKKIHVEEDDDIEVSPWVKEKERLGYEAENKAQKILKDYYTYVQKVTDDKGYDFKCKNKDDVHLIEVKSFGVRPTIFISSNQLRTMSMNPVDYRLFLYNRETEEYWLIDYVLDMLNMQFNDIMKNLGNGKNEIYVEKIKVTLAEDVLSSSLGER